MTKEMTVGAYMDRKGPVLRPETPITTAMDLLLKHRALAAIVVDEKGLPVGVLSENDCLKVILQQTYYQQNPEDTVATYMHEAPPAVAADTPIDMASRIFRTSDHQRLPVMAGEKMVGQISRRELVRALHLRLFFNR